MRAGSAKNVSAIEMASATGVGNRSSQNKAQSNDLGFNYRRTLSMWRKACLIVLQQSPIDICGLRIETNDDHPLDPSGVPSDFGHGDLSGNWDGKW